MIRRISMKRYLWITALVAIVLSFSTTAIAGSDNYITGFLGYKQPKKLDGTFQNSKVEMDFDGGLVLGAAYGEVIGNNRVELEVSYQINNLDKVVLDEVETPSKGDSSVTSLLFVGYHDFKNNSPVTPFISAGFGVARIAFNDFSLPGSGLGKVNDEDFVGAYQVGAGIGYTVSDKLFLDARYRYFDIADPKFEGDLKTEFSSHNFMLGLRIAL